MIVNLYSIQRNFDHMNFDVTKIAHLRSILSISNILDMMKIIIENTIKIAMNLPQLYAINLGSAKRL